MGETEDMTGGAGEGRAAMITFLNPSTDPCYNLALEESLFRTVRDEDVFLVWRNAPCVVAGSGQNLCRLPASRLLCRPYRAKQRGYSLGRPLIT